MAQNIFPRSCLLKLIRSYVHLCKRCITPSYDSLVAQKLESHITHVFFYSLQLQKIALRNLASNQSLSDWGHIFAHSASCENGTSFNVFKIPTHVHFSLNHICMHVVNGDGSFRQIHSKSTVLDPASTPAGTTPSCYY